MAREKHEQEEAAKRVQVMVIPAHGAQEAKRAELTMALFVDGPAPTIEDLADQDAGLLRRGADHRHQRLDEAAAGAGRDQDRPRVVADQAAAGHRCGLANWSCGTMPRIEQVVVTPPLKRWETMHALELVYRDAYFSQLVDRYQAKVAGIREAGARRPGKFYRKRAGDGERSCPPAAGRRSSRSSPGRRAAARFMRAWPG